MSSPRVDLWKLTSKSSEPSNLCKFLQGILKPQKSNWWARILAQLWTTFTGWDKRLVWIHGWHLLLYQDGSTVEWCLWPRRRLVETSPTGGLLSPRTSNGMPPSGHQGHLRNYWLTVPQSICRMAPFRTAMLFSTDPDPRRPNWFKLWTIVSFLFYLIWTMYISSNNCSPKTHGPPSLNKPPKRYQAYSRPVSDPSPSLKSSTVQMKTDHLSPTGPK